MNHHDIIMPGNPAKLVIFDFDGTLLKGQSQGLLLGHLRERGDIAQIPYLRILAWFLCHRAGLLNDPRPVMEYALRFLKGWDVEKFEEIIKSLFDEKLKPSLYPASCELLRRHQEHGAKIVIVSNAIEPIVRSTAQHFGIRHFIATKLEVRDNRYTGRIHGPAVNGPAKALLVRDFAARNGLTLTDSIAYCDHISDLPLLEMVANPVAVNPDRGLLGEAKKRCWQTLYT